ncbi:hypothetical protein [Protaetiibacter intestinalis]|uniref:Uncharacterized protein n=1 Tax=Protaetiibacter intestinalis TaxID=2419774 RepID=A0A387B7F2_9MICO|nr:hypothetical protein [Protaetiibacter intestinalis]AYF97711.1 hypothetical protein D7I47_05215 [Protaetiibacter intestinalis]
MTDRADTALQFHYTADAGFAGRYARAMFLERQRGSLVFGAVLVLLMGALGFLESAFLLGAGLFLALMVVLQLVVLRETLRAARRGAPEGDTTVVRYDEVVLRLADADVDAFIPYARFRDVRPRGRFVAFRRVDAAPLLLPVELCPPEAVERVRAGIASRVVPQLDPAQFPHHATIDGGFLRAASRRVVVLMATHPTLLAVAAGVLVTGGALTVAFADPVPVVVAVAILVLWPITAIVGTRSAIRKQLGTETIWSGFDDEYVTVARGGEVLRMRYRAFDRFAVSRGAAELRVASTREWQLYPLGLFPAEVRARFS